MAFFGCTGLTSAVFADTNGWAVYNDWQYNIKHANIASTDLANTETTAKYLREQTDNDGYCDKYWKKN